MVDVAVLGLSALSIGSKGISVRKVIVFNFKV